MIISYRRDYTKRQRIIHSYGTSEDDIDEEEVFQMVANSLSDTAEESNQVPKKACACGGTDHSRRSSLKCPLNKRSKQ